ncbi:amino acid permease-domain-containing protein [Suillus subalutaceus]|uniref:amino acid permease-domain-containing protein n=1 Tax=Suillus subalutaceus TaxID=48586 RepID=UPI001B87E968|nr:amino acid permease-domain-containing protein [Suillus subalutaceus]KAG1855175.1 amino acid permease-domain-containing protein [Suillus subalutaceus]
MASPSSNSHSEHTRDEAVLARLGYKQEFRREFTPLEVFGVAFSIVGLLPSIASVLFNAMPNGGPLAMVWGWLFACAFIMCIGLAMAELASAAPTSGGLYYWTYSLASPRCRNFLSWIVGYSNTIASIAAFASVDWACAIQITAAVSIASNQVYVTTNGQIYGIFAALVLSHAVLVSLGTQILARLQRLYILLNVCLCFIVIIALPIATPSEFRNSASYALGDFTNLDGWPSGFAFILSLLAPLWTIGGYDSSVHMSEEASNATTAIPWAIIGSIAISAALGWGINVSLVFCMGSDLEGILSSPIGQPMAQIFYNSFGQKGALALWSLVIVAHYTGTPVNTVWLDALLALAIGLLAFVSTQAINAIFTLVVTSSYISYITPIATRFAFKNDFKPGPFNLGKFSFPVAAIAVSWMVFMNMVFFFPTTPQTTAQEMNYTVVVLGGFMSLAVFWYYCPVYGGVHWFNGPVSNLMSAEKGQDDESASEKTGKGRGVDVLIVDA